MTEVRVPALGESVTEAIVATWRKSPGDAVATDEILCELETDKVAVEVPAPTAGVLGEIAAPEGSSVEVDALLATISEGAAAKPDSPKGASGKRKASAPASGGLATIAVPALGESIAEATVGSWSKGEGDAVEADEILCELETDKVAVEVPAPAAGVIETIMAREGDKVAPGQALGAIRPGASAAAPPQAAAPRPAAKSAARGDVADAPSARRIMAERGISPDSVAGTGRGGRVMKEDLMAGPAKAAPRPAPESGGDDHPVKMTSLRKTIARRLKDAQNTAAILTTFNEVDMTEIIGIRSDYKDIFEKKHGIKLGFMPFFVKACCQALLEVPEVNAETDGEYIIYKNYVHMGVAVGTPAGLVVPVVRNAHAMSFVEIEAEIASLGKLARDGKLSMEQMRNGSFTISNGGVYGSLMSSPILNPPQSGILGMHKIQQRPVALGGEVAIRPMMYLALSYDHRIIDGKGAVTFLVRVKEALEDPRRLLMEV